MNSLLIDTHSDYIYIAIYQNEKLSYEKKIEDEKEHSRITIPTLVEVLTESKLTLPEIDDIVVINGPGSFTGVRIGVTIAKTLAFTLNKPIRTMTSLELYLTNEAENKYLVLPEKNGYYVGKVENGQINDYEYIKKDEYAIWKDNKELYLCEQVDTTNLIIRAHQKPTVNPHYVNPFYVKKIEALK